MMMEYFFSVFFGTFILEDLALAAAVSSVAAGLLSTNLAFWAAFLGITLGDLGLYGLGYMSSHFGWERRIPFLGRLASRVRELKYVRTLSYSIVLSRLIPGTRLPTYFGAGYLRYPFYLFTVLTVASVSLWVIVALFIGRSIQLLFIDHLFLSVGLFLLVIHLSKVYIPQLIDPWRRRALLQSYRQWFHFEFWPAWFFYIPVVTYYIYLSLRRGSALLPFYINPNLKNGGLIGESKWDFLKHLDPGDNSTLKSTKVGSGVDFQVMHDLIEIEGYEYPFILKPDVGQRGYAVRIIRNVFELTQYLLLSRSEIIIQKLSLNKFEAGIFYVRMPGEENGRIFSITDKSFPFVVGNGKLQLGDLILKDSRARIIAATYFDRLGDRLGSVPSSMEKVAISECGNHCQGALFRNGEDLMTPALSREIDRLAKMLPDFYFGRFDVRYRDAASLREGKAFEIIEINGAGSEATHIWDPQTRLIDAYRTLFEQWRLAFEIGYRLKNRGAKSADAPVRLIPFAVECLKVYRRKDKLSVSS